MTAKRCSCRSSSGQKLTVNVKYSTHARLHGAYIEYDIGYSILVCTTAHCRPTHNVGLLKVSSLLLSIFRLLTLSTFLSMIYSFLVFTAAEVLKVSSSSSSSSSYYPLLQ